MVGEVIIDGTRLCWQDFADRLMALSASRQQHGTSGYFRPPQACQAEARRLLRNLDLDDCIELMIDEPGPRRGAFLPRLRIWDFVTTALAAIRPPIARRHRPFHD